MIALGMMLVCQGKHEFECEDILTFLFFSLSRMCSLIESVTTTVLLDRNRS